MRHHFADLLDRDGGYWTTVPNRERYAHRIGQVPAASAQATIVTLGKEDAQWSHVLTLPNLVEVTLHEPTPEQMAAVGAIQSIRRLRVTHARPKTIDFISAMQGLEELVLEYVSGFSDLAPLRALKRLRSLHLENLRRVSDFTGLAGVPSLRYLAIDGTLDWQQPIDGFEFLRGLPDLEVLALWQIKCRAPYPATLEATRLGKLQRLRLHGSYLDSAEYALLEEGLPGVAGAAWGPYAKVAGSQMDLPSDDARAHLPVDIIRAEHPEVHVWHDGRRAVDDPATQWFEFTGRGAGRVKCSSASAQDRCRAQAERYQALRQRARTVLDDAQAHPGPHRTVSP